MEGDSASPIGDFFQSGWLPYLWEQFTFAVSILILSCIIYRGYRVLRDAGSLQLLRGAFSIVFLYLFAYLLNLDFLLWLMDRIIPTLLIFMAIIMQPELRRIFMVIGRQRILNLRIQKRTEQKISEILQAAQTLSSMGRGASIVFIRENGLKEILETGTPLDALTSRELLISIFGYDTPLHDGAAIIKGNRILSCSCILPIFTEKSQFNTNKGTRHRSAFQLVHNTDAISLIVSEETGRISLALDSRIYSRLTIEDIAKILKEKLNTAETKDQKSFFYPFLRFLPLGHQLFPSFAKPRPNSPSQTAGQNARTVLSPPPHPHSGSEPKN